MVQYAKNEKAYLCHTLEDGKNNRAENTIRPFTISRKNLIFSASVKGACASAMSTPSLPLHVSLSPEEHLTSLFSHLPERLYTHGNYEKRICPAGF